MDEKSAHCGTCRRQVLARRHGPNHVLHLLLSVVTAGLWLIPWFLLATTTRASTYVCPSCGNSVFGAALSKRSGGPVAARLDRCHELGCSCQAFRPEGNTLFCVCGHFAAEHHP